MHKVDDGKRSSRRAVTDFVLAGRRPALVRLAATGFLGGLAEAVFLVVVTRTAFAITDGDDRVGLIASWYVDVSAALSIGVALVIIRVGLALAGSWQAARLSTSSVARLRGLLADAFVDSSWELQQRQRAGSLQELLTSFSAQAIALTTGVNQAVLSFANLLGLLGLAIAVDPIGAIVLVVAVGVLGSLLRPLRRVVQRRARESSQAGMAFATSVNEIAQLGLELHVFHVQDQARNRLRQLIEQSRKRNERLQIAQGLTVPVYSGVAYLALLCALGVVSVSNVTSLTSLGAALLVMLRSLTYGQALQGAYTTISGSVPPLQELQAQIERLRAGRNYDGGRPVGKVGPIAADAVSFEYIPGQPVLNRLSFDVAEREIVGIVGPSGSGKSTLVQLLLGLRPPSSGTILADGRDISHFSRAEWARRVTFVPQSAHLIAGSIADNVRFLRPDVTDEEVERAARLAHLHDDILRFPEGYERQVGEHGGHLSGGQQQRLCIARALVEHPDVLILDEPTSALDVRSEHLIRRTLLDLRNDMTLIVIAHRLSTLDICDRIMVIQNGELRGFDSPVNLERSSEFYREALTLSGLR